MTETLSSANIYSSLQCMIRIWIWIYVFLAVCWWLVSWPSLRVPLMSCHDVWGRGPDAAVTWRRPRPAPATRAHYISIWEVCVVRPRQWWRHSSYQASHTVNIDPSTNVRLEGDGLLYAAFTDSFTKFTATTHDRGNQKLDTSTDNGSDCVGRTLLWRDKNCSNKDIARIWSIIQ